MGSGLLLAVLVVLWIVVLVPALLNNRPHSTASGSSERVGSSMRVLTRKGSATDTGATSKRVSTRPPRVSAERHAAETVARRRRTLLGLICLAVVWLLFALFYRSYFWTAQIVLDVTVIGYVAYLRRETQRERERRERREARFGARPPASRPLPVRRSSPVATPASVASEPMTPAAVNPEGWTPSPIPPPTYVGKEAAPRRHYELDEPPGIDQMIDLDDEDPSFADITEWQPQRAVGD